MSEIIRVLFVEDNQFDAEIFSKMLTRQYANSVDLFHAESLEEALKLLEKQPFDLVLLDLMLPDSQGLQTLARIKMKTHGAPVLALTVLDDERLGLQAIKEGAEDYLVKGEWNQKFLSRVIRYAIERKRQKTEMEQLIQTLRDALGQVKTLKGIIPICAVCKKIRDKEGYWHRLENYIRRHSEAQLSHGFCPGCIEHYS